MAKIDRRETSRLAIEKAEKDSIVSLLNSVINNEDKGKRYTHVRDIVVLTAKSRYLENGDGLDIDLGPTIAIAQHFRVSDWKLLVKHWKSVPDDVKVSVRTIAFDTASWHTYVKNIGNEDPNLLAHIALEGALIIARQKPFVASSLFDSVLGPGRDLADWETRSASPERTIIGPDQLSGQSIHASISPSPSIISTMPRNSPGDDSGDLFYHLSPVEIAGPTHSVITRYHESSLSLTTGDTIQHGATRIKRKRTDHPALDIENYNMNTTCSLASRLEVPHATTANHLLRVGLPTPGPSLQLTMQYEVPDTADSIVFATEGNVEGLKLLFTHGFASPSNWALYGGMHQFETVRFLISQGAPIDRESYGHVWDFSFRLKCNDDEFKALSCIREGLDNDWIEDQNYQPVHKIVLHLSSENLTAELEKNPNAVHLKDAQGRTALDWATARAQLTDMKVLIYHSSDVNNMDTTGRTTILHAVDSHSYEALQIVLAAGAIPDPIVPPNLFRSSPLTSACFGGLADMVRLLIKHGANIRACNPEGRTALHTVAIKGHVECATILLNHGADLNEASMNGRTPLMMAIIHNKHDILKLFLEHCQKYHGLQNSGLLGTIIAEHADADTMSILASSHHLLKLLGLDGSCLLRHAFEGLLAAAFSCVNQLKL
ncbi:hypothetical protein M9X92_011542 [Pyricularia oryzae]|nr:hypothetical protein M9X92_011542 [Pyricularia oryzae]